MFKDERQRRMLRQKFTWTMYVEEERSKVRVGSATIYGTKWIVGVNLVAIWLR